MPGRDTENTCSMPEMRESTCSAGRDTSAWTSLTEAPGNGISTLAMVTLICGSSSRGVTSTANRPSSSAASAISGVSALRWKRAAVRAGSPICVGGGRRRGRGKGGETPQGRAAARGAARHLAVRARATVAITGAVDYVTDGQRVIAIDNGHPLMARVTGLGCSATAVIGAFLAVEQDALTATAAALAVFGTAGELAAAEATGPGTLQVTLLDQLYGLNEQLLAKTSRWQIITCS